MLAAKQIETGGTGARGEDLALALQHHTAGRLDDAPNSTSDCILRTRAIVKWFSSSTSAPPAWRLSLDLAPVSSPSALDIAPAFPEARSQLPVALNGLADLRISAGKLTEARQNS